MARISQVEETWRILSIWLLQAKCGGGGGIRTCDQGLMSPCWRVRRRSPPSDFPCRDAEKAEKRTGATGGEPRRLSGRWMLSGCTVCGGAPRGACRSALNRDGVKRATGIHRSSCEAERVSAIDMPL